MLFQRHWPRSVPPPALATACACEIPCNQLIIKEFHEINGGEKQVAMQLPRWRFRGFQIPLMPQAYYHAHGPAD
ncbi:MAG TPA: hypothetical protein VGN52_17940 [Burkholderiales bacterium]|jgi:hypothetical protein